MKAEGKKITLRLPGEVYGALREIENLDEYIVNQPNTKRITVIFPLDLHQRLKDIAEKEGLTMNALIISYLNRSMN